MAISQKIIKFLEKSKVKYELLKHRTVYTAFDKAATLKVRPNLIGKTLVLKTGKDLVIVLISGNKNLDKNKFKKVVNNWQKKIGQKPFKNVDFISEKLIKNKFKGVKFGVIPPFGNLWKLTTFVDNSLLKEPKIIVNSGEYNFSIKINPRDFKKITPETSAELSRIPLITGNFGKSRK